MDPTQSGGPLRGWKRLIEGSENQQDKTQKLSKVANKALKSAPTKPSSLKGKIIKKSSMFFGLTKAHFWTLMAQVRFPSSRSISFQQVRKSIEIQTEVIKTKAGSAHRLDTSSRTVGKSVGKAHASEYTAPVPIVGDLHIRINCKLYKFNYFTDDGINVDFLREDFSAYNSGVISKDAIKSFEVIPKIIDYLSPEQIDVMKNIGYTFKQGCLQAPRGQSLKVNCNGSEWSIDVVNTKGAVQHILKVSTRHQRSDDISRALCGVLQENEITLYPPIHISIELKDGSSFITQLKGLEDDGLHVISDGKQIVYPVDKIASCEITPKINSFGLKPKVIPALNALKITIDDNGYLHVPKDYDYKITVVNGNPYYEIVVRDSGMDYLNIKVAAP